MSRSRRIPAVLLALAAAQPLSAANHEVRLDGLSFIPRTLEIATGDTVTFRNVRGFHNVIADNGSFDSGAPSDDAWTYTVQFNAPGDQPYFCDVHGSPGGIGMSGLIKVTGAATTVNIGEYLQGSWFNPPTSGQGFLVEVSPALTLFNMAWFTWTGTAGQYDWLTGAGPYAGNRAEITLFRTRNGRFNDPTPVNTTPAGSAVFTFDSCSTGSVTFTLTDPPATGTIPLQRVLPASAQCVANRKVVVLGRGTWKD